MNKKTKKFDRNGNGTLDFSEYTQCLAECPNMDLSKSDIVTLALSADLNGDGVIEYDEFMPAMLAVIAAMKDGAVAQAVDSFEIGMPNPADVPADMMADYLQKLFKVADSNDDGVLSPIEFAELLSRSGFNFPENVIAALVKAADANEDGVIEYNEKLVMIKMTMILSF